MFHIMPPSTADFSTTALGAVLEDMTIHRFVGAVRMAVGISEGQQRSTNAGFIPAIASRDAVCLGSSNRWQTGGGVALQNYLSLRERSSVAAAKARSISQTQPQPSPDCAPPSS